MSTVREKGMEAMADTIPYAAVGANASELAKAMIRELLLGQTVEGYCGNCGVIKNAEVPEYEVSPPLPLYSSMENGSQSLEC